MDESLDACEEYRQIDEISVSPRDEADQEDGPPPTLLSRFGSGLPAIRRSPGMMSWLRLRTLTTDSEAW